MDNEKIQETLIDYIDGTLTPAARQEVEHILSTQPEVRQRYLQLKQLVDAMDRTALLEPSATLQTNFNRALENEMAQRTRRVMWIQGSAFYRIAAAVALLILGGGIGFWINAYHQQQLQLEAMRREIAATKHAMFAMIENRHSASQRLQGVNVAYKMELADDEIVTTLVHTMNEDPNTNVRLAALEALTRFHQQPHVRKALVASLAVQKDPVVQIALIRFMVDMKEKEVVHQLQRITNDAETLPVVKDEAHAGILRLS